MVFSWGGPVGAGIGLAIGVGLGIVWSPLKYEEKPSSIDSTQDLSTTNLESVSEKNESKPILAKKPEPKQKASDSLTHTPPVLHSRSPLVVESSSPSLSPPPSGSTPGTKKKGGGGPGQSGG